MLLEGGGLFKSGGRKKGEKIFKLPTELKYYGWVNNSTGTLLPVEMIKLEIHSTGEIIHMFPKPENLDTNYAL